jgi:hypothetical protein
MQLIVAEIIAYGAIITIEKQRVEIDPGRFTGNTLFGGTVQRFDLLAVTGSTGQHTLHVDLSLWRCSVHGVDDLANVVRYNVGRTVAQAQIIGADQQNQFGRFTFNDMM